MPDVDLPPRPPAAQDGWSVPGVPQAHLRVGAARFDVPPQLSEAGRRDPRPPEVQDAVGRHYRGAEELSLQGGREDRMTAAEKLEWFALGFIAGATVVGLAMLYMVGNLFWHCI